MDGNDALEDSGNKPDRDLFLHLPGFGIGKCVVCAKLFRVDQYFQLKNILIYLDEDRFADANRFFLFGDLAGMLL